MSDLEGLTRNLLSKGYSEQEILERLVQEYQDFKDIEKEDAFKFARAILEECQKSDINLVKDPYIREILAVNQATVSVGRQGVGCRGIG
ncbi:MAG: hypothetical protein ACW96S_01835, partial [Promethearchaeota archaeon]